MRVMSPHVIFSCLIAALFIGIFAGNGLAAAPEVSLSAIIFLLAIFSDPLRRFLVYPPPNVVFFLFLLNWMLCVFLDFGDDATDRAREDGDDGAGPDQEEARKLSDMQPLHLLRRSHWSLLAFPLLLRYQL
ncbi:hypothetical protein SAY86_027575 [Trapa natans]|uniref:Uncharacterized protein n=1 Tax=Trapa natans TaxID=22666 RepID=A0AAN7KMM7_TRANT|nr:hypothetical protein SAY86_027575 [Trapa natans]